MIWKRGDGMNTIAMAVYIRTAVKNTIVIKNQVSRCTEKVKGLYPNCRLEVRVFNDDNTLRTGFNKMVNAIDKNEIQVVCCINTSRIAENVLELFYLIRYLYQKKVRLICADGSLDMADEVFRKYQLNLLSILAEMEYVNINERKKMALQ